MSRADGSLQYSIQSDTILMMQIGAALQKAIS
jgi:hypothetical protein